MVDKTVVAELLAYQVSPSQIADALGCSSNYIHELARDDEETRLLIAEKAGAIATREHNNKVTMEQIEHDLLAKIKAQIDYSDSLIESTKCLQLLKDIQGKSRALSHGASAENPTSIDINLGHMGADIKIQRNGQNEIISIAGRDMAPMPAHKVIQTVKERQGKNGEAEEVYVADETVPATDCL